MVCFIREKEVIHIAEHVSKIYTNMYITDYRFHQNVVACQKFVSLPYPKLSADMPTFVAILTAWHSLLEPLICPLMYSKKVAKESVPLMEARHLFDLSPQFCEIRNM